MIRSHLCAIELSLLLSLTFSIKEALNSEIENNAIELLGGDIQVDSDIEPLPNQVIEQFNELGMVSATIEFATMLSKEGESPVLQKTV